MAPADLRRAEAREDPSPLRYSPEVRYKRVRPSPGTPAYPIHCPSVLDQPSRALWAR